MSEVTEPETPATAPEPEVPDAPEPDENDDDDDDDEPEAQVAPEPQPSGISLDEREKRSRKIEQSFQTYAASVARNHPEYESDLIPCLLCPPAHPGFLNIHDAGRVPREVTDAVQAFLGFAREIDYAPAPDTRTCGTCNGEGKVDSGSHVPEHRTRTCPTCIGYGYEPPPGGVQNGARALAPSDAAVAATVPAGPPADVDEWGEPRILPDGRSNPNYGRMPVHKVAVEPWGATAGLTAQN